MISQLDLLHMRLENLRAFVSLTLQEVYSPFAF